MGQLLQQWSAALSGPAAPAPGRVTPAPPPKQTAAEPESGRPIAPRRIVLLEDGEASSVAHVLVEYRGADARQADLHAAVRYFAADHPGRCVAAEWEAKLGWTRFLWCRKATAG